MSRVARIFQAALFVAVLSLAGVCAADYVWAEYRLARATGAEALGTVTFYYATPLKSGRLEIFYSQPQTEVCIYALLPHAGYRPCWYAKPQKIRTVS